MNIMKVEKMTNPAGEIAEKLRAGLEGVTPGPWAVQKWRKEYAGSVLKIDFVYVKGTDPNDTTFVSFEESAHDDDFECNAAHIANCDPDSIRILLDALKAALAEAKRGSTLKLSVLDDLDLAQCRLFAANKLLEEAAGTLDLWREIPLARDTLAAINAHLAGVKKGEG